MRTIACIVEGDSEMAALPILLRRLGGWRTPDSYPDVRPPIRVRRDRFLNKDEDFRRHLLLASAKAGSSGWILILLDADDDCPAILGKVIAGRVRDLIPHQAVAVVLAMREYEAWFIAAAPSLDGHRGFVLGTELPPEAETRRDAKGWVGKHMVDKAYSEVIDQPALTDRMDLQMAYDNSRSFRKLCGEWDKHMKGSGAAESYGERSPAKNH
ncbi:MAG: DUF4276 family protein [Candidimonas sp.]|nr:MAG: DUF4276 family protein [Candidimonas sp.]